MAEFEGRSIQVQKLIAMLELSLLFFKEFDFMEMFLQLKRRKRSEVHNAFDTRHTAVYVVILDSL